MPSETLLHKKLTTQTLQAPSNESRLWKDTILYSFIIFIIVSGYYYITNSTFSYRILNRVVADISLILIGLSLMLSSICYFWNFADKYIIYRKHLGLVGVGYMLFHIFFSISLPTFQPILIYYLDEKRVASFVAATIATLIFLGMTLISNRLAIVEIGAQRWRKIMRFGYLGFILVLFHFGSKGMPYWQSWIFGRENSPLFPSFGLIVFLFGLVVVGLRIALWISTTRTQKQNVELNQN